MYYYYYFILSSNPSYVTDFHVLDPSINFSDHAPSPVCHNQVS